MKKVFLFLTVAALVGCSKEPVDPVKLWQCSCKSYAKDGYIIEFPNTVILRTEQGMRDFEKAGTRTDANASMVTQCTPLEKP